MVTDWWHDDSLFSKRPLVFVGVRDTYILRDNDKPEMAYDKWQAVGTDEEEPPILMRFKWSSLEYLHLILTLIGII